MWPSVATSDRGEPTNYSLLLPNHAQLFVDDGLRIETMYSQPMSAPSRRSLFSGRFMTQVGRPFGQINSLSTRISTIGERLKSAGCARSLGRSYLYLLLDCRARADPLPPAVETASPSLTASDLTPARPHAFRSVDTTAFHGKWFLGYATRSAQPRGRGFDSSIGFHLQSTEQYGYSAVSLGRERTSRGEIIHDLFINDTRVTRDHPYIASANGKIRYPQTEHPGGRLAMFEAGDHYNASSRLIAQADDELGRHYAQVPPPPIRPLDPLSSPPHVCPTTPHTPMPQARSLSLAHGPSNVWPFSPALLPSCPPAILPSPPPMLPSATHPLPSSPPPSFPSPLRQAPPPPLSSPAPLLPSAGHL